MSVSLIQTGTVSSALGTVKIVMPSSLTAGNILVLGFGNVSGGTNYGIVSDNLNNSYTQALGVNDTSTRDLEIYYGTNIVSGAGTISIVNAGLHTINAIAREYAGVRINSPLDQQAQLGKASGTSANTGTTPNTTVGSQLVVAFTTAGGTVTPTYDATFADGTIVNTAANTLSLLAQDKIISTTGAQVGTFGFSSAHTSAAGIVTFIANGAGTNLIQSTGTAVLGLGSTSVTWGANTTTGNLIVVGITLTNASTLGTVTSVVDSQSNMYVKAVSGTKNSNLVSVIDEEIWYANTITGGAGSVTVNHTIDNCAIFAREYSGFNTLDVTGSATGSSTTPNSGTQTTNFATELLVVSTGDDKGAGQTYTVAGNFGDMVGTTTTLTGVSMEDNIVISTGAQTGTLTLGSSADWVSLMATFYNLVASAGPAGLKTLLGVGM